MNYGSEFRNYIQMSKIHELRNFHNKGKNRVISEYVERLQSNSNQVFDDLCDKQERYLYNLVRYISGSCKFTIMVTDQFLDAHRIFCNLNLSGELKRLYFLFSLKFNFFYLFLGEPLSPLDLYRARFYGQMVNEKGLSEANRSIDSKLKIWNKIHAELGNSEMSCFLSHVCRIKLVERNDEEKFIASFSYKEEQVINFLGECTDNIQASEEFFKQVETLLAIWNKIFRSSEPNASRDALKLIRSNHYEVWITMALTAGYHNVLLNKDFWMSLDKYITILMVVLSSRYACSYSESNEVLHRCYKNIKWTLEWKEISLTLEPFEINEFKERIQGDLYTNITEYCIVYLLMRIALGKKSELTKNSQSIEKMAVDLVTPLNFNTSDDDSILSRYAGHIGNLILVDSAHLDKFRNKSWAEKKSNIGFAKVYPSTVTVLSLDVWNVESFKRVQEYYISLIGKCYEIAELKDYKMSFVQKRKLNVIQLDDNSNASAREDIAVVECVANNETVAPVSKKRKIQEVTTSNKIDDYTILLAATQLNAYLRENRRPNCVGIIECLKRIDPESIGHLEDDLVFRLLIRLQKQYKMYAKRWQTTFKKWIREANRPGLGCYYAGIFLTNDYLPNRT